MEGHMRVRLHRRKASDTDRSSATPAPRVHAWSYPLWYLRRPYIVVRSRTAARPPEPGTGGREWRKIGVPY